jgi:hypothetical protein
LPSFRQRCRRGRCPPTHICAAGPAARGVAAGPLFTHSFLRSWPCGTAAWPPSGVSGTAHCQDSHSFANGSPAAASAPCRVCKAGGGAQPAASSQQPAPHNDAVANSVAKLWPRLWSVRCWNNTKEVSWRLAANALPTADRMPAAAACLHTCCLNAHLCLHTPSAALRASVYVQAECRLSHQAALHARRCDAACGHRQQCPVHSSLWHMHPRNYGGTAALPGE